MKKRLGLYIFLFISSIYSQSCNECGSGFNLQSGLDCLEDIDYHELDTYDGLTETIKVGYNIKNGIIERGAGDLFFVGTTPDTTILVLRIAPGGQPLSVNENFSKGWAHGIIRANDNFHYIVVGTTIDMDMFLMKITPLGQIVHFKTFKQFFNTPVYPAYGPGNVDIVVGYDVAATSDSNYVVTGYFNQTEKGKRIFIVKASDTEDNFELEWLRTYDYEGTIGSHILEDSQGNLVISGYKWGKNFLYKTDANGIRKWDKWYNDTQEDNFNNIINTSLGNHLTLLSQFSVVSEEIIVSEVTSNLEEVRNGDFGDDDTGKDDKAYFIQPTRDNHYVVLGKETFSNQLVLFKITSELQNCQTTNLIDDICFNETYTSSPYEIPVGIIQQKNLENNFGFIICSITSQNGREYELRIIKTDEKGIVR